MIDIVHTGLSVAKESMWVMRDILSKNTHPDIPVKSSFVDAEWLTRVLQPRLNGTRIKSVETVYEESGTTAHLRISISYSTSQAESDLQETLFLKLPPHAFLSKMIGSKFDLYRNEVQFYNDIGHEFEALIPKVYFAKAADRGSSFVVLMEDLKGKNLYTKDITTPCTLKEAEGVIRLLAKIHGRFWESPRFKNDLSWLTTYDTDKNNRVHRLLRKYLIPRVAAKYGELIPDSIANASKLIVDRFDNLERLWALPPQTLIHGDTHLGNIYFYDKNVGLLDWQVVRRGQGMRDVANFIINSLSREMRRKHEEDLIRLYLELLSAVGVTVPSFSETHKQYRLHALYPWYANIVTLAAGKLQAEKIAITGVKRASNALIDLDSLSLLRSVAIPNAVGDTGPKKMLPIKG